MNLLAQVGFSEHARLHLNCNLSLATHTACDGLAASRRKKS